MLRAGLIDARSPRAPAPRRPAGAPDAGSAAWRSRRSDTPCAPKCTLPSAQRTSSCGACSRCAPMRRIFSASMRQARRHRAARHRHAARGEGAHAVRRHRAVAVPHDDSATVDAEFLVGDLRQRRFQALAVLLDADEQDQLAVGREARQRRLVAEHDRQPARDPFGRAVRGLLGVARHADADQPAVRLGLRCRARIAGESIARARACAHSG